MLVNPSSLLQDLVFHRLKVFDNVSCTNSHGYDFISIDELQMAWIGHENQGIHFVCVYSVVVINMQMNFADGMDWTQGGIHFVCVYLVVDELRIAGGMDWTRRGIHSVLCIFSC